MKKLVRAATGSAADMLNAFQDKLAGLETGVVTSTKVEADEGYSKYDFWDDLYDEDEEEEEPNYQYAVEDTYGAPQAGVDVKKFQEWYELEEYLDQNPDVEERIEEGYARIVEL